MFPEFATTFRDKNNKVHLYIFPGIDENGKQIYKNLDLSTIKAKYEFIKKDDNTTEFIFEDNITALQCIMIHAKDGTERKFIFKNV